MGLVDAERSACGESTCLRVDEELPFTIARTYTECVTAQREGLTILL